MKYHILIFFIAAWHGVSSQFTPVDIMNTVGSQKVFSQFSNMIRKNCNHENAGFQEKVKDMQKCYLEFRGKETFCGSVRNHLVNCTQPVVDTLEKCVEAKYHDIQRFVVDVVSSTIDYLCDAKGEKIIELLHPCLTSVGYSKYKVCLNSFQQKIENIEKDDSIQNIKIDVCKSLEKTKGCFLDEFRDTCKNDITMEAAVGFYDALITKPCKHGK